MEIRVRKCCAVCDNLYNDKKCPAFRVYYTAGNCGDETFDNEAKYKIYFESFILSKKLN